MIRAGEDEHRGFIDIHISRAREALREAGYTGVEFLDIPGLKHGDILGSGPQPLRWCEGILEALPVKDPALSSPPPAR